MPPKHIEFRALSVGFNRTLVSHGSAKYFYQAILEQPMYSTIVVLQNFVWGKLVRTNLSPITISVFTEPKSDLHGSLPTTFEVDMCFLFSMH